MRPWLCLGVLLSEAVALLPATATQAQPGPCAIPVSGTFAPAGQPDKS